MLSGGLWGKQAWAGCQSTRLGSRSQKGWAAQRVSLAFGLRARGPAGPGSGVPLAYSVVWVSTQLRKDEWVISTNPWVFWLVSRQGAAPAGAHGALTNHRASGHPLSGHQTPEPRPWYLAHLPGATPGTGLVGWTH